MKIQIVSLTKSDYSVKKIGRWYYLPSEFRKKAKLKYNLRKDFWRFYWDYLSFKPDVVICVGLIGGIVGFFKRIGFIRKPLVFDWNDYLAEIRGAGKSAAFSSMLEYGAVKSSDLVITPSRYLESICKSLGKKVIYIQHGVDKSFYKKDKIKLPGKNKIKAVYIGEQSKYKRVDKLVSAVRGLKVDLILVGKINESLRKASGENVYFIGNVLPNDVYRYVNSADICCLPSDQDSALKIFEYTSAGKAILGTKGRLGYVLTHLENSYLADNLIDGFKKLSRDARLRKRLERGSMRFKNYSWEEIAEQYLKALRALAKR